MEIINTIQYYLKAEKVLYSCTNIQQLKNSFNYIKLYYERTEDFSGYNVLLRKYHKLSEDMELNEKTTNY